MPEARGPQKPRLLVLASTYPRWADDPEPGFVHELARRLTGEFEVQVLAPHATGAAAVETLDGVRVRRFRYAPERLESLVNHGGIVTNLKRHRWKWLLVPPFLLAQAWTTWRALREFRPHLVHAHWIIPQGLLAAGLAGKARAPLLVTSHGADLFALRAPPFEVLKRWVVRRASRLTVVSAAMKDELVRLDADPSTVEVAPMGVDLRERFVPGPVAGVRGEELLFVGRLVEKKGLRYLIEALPRVGAQRPDVALTVAGFGPEEPALRALAAQLGVGDRVKFLGPVSQRDLPALYRRAAALVAPFVEAESGDQEGLGLVMVEAIGCGCPVIASDLPAVRDVLDHRVPPGRPDLLADAILALLARPREQTRAECAALRERALVRFDWVAVAAGYAARLRHLLSPAHPVTPE